MKRKRTSATLEWELISNYSTIREILKMKIPRSPFVAVGDLIWKKMIGEPVESQSVATLEGSRYRDTDTIPRVGRVPIHRFIKIQHRTTGPHLHCPKRSRSCNCRMDAHWPGIRLFNGASSLSIKRLGASVGRAFRSPGPILISPNYHRLPCINSRNFRSPSSFTTRPGENRGMEWNEREE